MLFTGRGPAMPLRLLRGPDLDVFTEKALLPKGTQVSEPANMKAGDTSGASLHC